MAAVSVLEEIDSKLSTVFNIKNSPMTSGTEVEKLELLANLLFLYDETWRLESARIILGNHQKTGAGSDQLRRGGERKKLRRFLELAELGHLATDGAQLTEGKRFGKLVTGILDKLDTKYGGQLVSKVRSLGLSEGRRVGKENSGVSPPHLPREEQAGLRTPLAESTQPRVMVTSPVDIPTGKQLARTPPRDTSSVQGQEEEGGQLYVSPTDRRRVSSFYSPSSAEPAKARRSKVQQARKTKMMEVSVSEFDVSTIVAAVPAHGTEIARTPELRPATTEPLPGVAPSLARLAVLQETQRLNRSDVSRAGATPSPPPLPSPHTQADSSLPLPPPPEADSSLPPPTEADSSLPPPPEENSSLPLPPEVYLHPPPQAKASLPLADSSLPPPPGADTRLPLSPSQPLASLPSSPQLPPSLPPPATPGTLLAHHTIPTGRQLPSTPGLAGAAAPQLQEPTGRYELPSSLEAVAIPTEQQLEEERRKRGEEDGKRQQLIAKELERKMKEQRKKEEVEEKKRMAAEEKRKRQEEEEEERKKLEESKRSVEEERLKLASRMEELEKKEKRIRDEEEKMNAEKQKKVQEELERKKENEDFKSKVKALEEERKRLAEEQRKMEEKKRLEEEKKRHDLERSEKEADVVKERQRLVSERHRLERERLEAERKKFEEDKRETQQNLVKAQKKREDLVVKKTGSVAEKSRLSSEGQKSGDRRRKGEECEAVKNMEEEGIQVAVNEKGASSEELKLVEESCDVSKPRKNGVVTANVKKPNMSKPIVENEVFEKNDHTEAVPAAGAYASVASLPDLSREPLLASVARPKMQKRLPSKRKEESHENVEDVSENCTAEKTGSKVEEVVKANESVEQSSRRLVNNLVEELSEKHKKQEKDKSKTPEKEAECLEGVVVEDGESRTGAKASESVLVKEADAVVQSSSILTETPVKIKTSVVRRRQCNKEFEAVEVTKKLEHAEPVDATSEAVEKGVVVKKKVVKKGKVKKIFHMSRSTVGKKVEQSEKLNLTKEETANVKGKVVSEPPKASGSCQVEKVGALLLGVGKGLLKHVTEVVEVTQEAPDEVFEAPRDTSRRSSRSKKTVPLVVVEPASAAKHEPRKKRKGVASIEEPPSPVKKDKKEAEKTSKRRGAANIEAGSPVKKVKPVVAEVQKVAEAKSQPHDSSLMTKLAARRRQSEGLTTARYEAKVEAAKWGKQAEVVVESSLEKKIAARRKKVEPAVVLDEIDESVILMFPSPVKRLAPPPASGRGGLLSPGRAGLLSPGGGGRCEDTQEYFSAADETRNMTARPRRNAKKKFHSFVGVDADTPEHREEVVEVARPAGRKAGRAREEVARPVGRRAGRGRDSEVKAALRDGRADVSVSEPLAPLATSTTAKLPTGDVLKAGGTARRGKKRTSVNPAMLTAVEDEIYRTPCSRLLDAVYETPQATGVFADMTDEQYLTPEVETPGPRARRSGRTARK